MVLQALKSLAGSRTSLFKTYFKEVLHAQSEILDQEHIG